MCRVAVFLLVTMTIDIPISKRVLRLILGVLTLILPLVLPLGMWLLGADHIFQRSISAYYYTEVKLLFLILIIPFGLILILYGMISRRNGWILIATGILSMLAALIPTHAPDNMSHAMIGNSHMVCSVLFFALLGWVIRDTLNLPPGFSMLSKIGIWIWIVLSILIVYFLAFHDLWPPMVYVLETVILWLFTLGIYIRNRISNKTYRLNTVADNPPAAGRHQQQRKSPTKYKPPVCCP